MNEFQNHDLSLNKFLLRNDFSELIADPSLLLKNRLSEKMYFSSANFPVASVADSSLGSGFDDYFVPTGSYIFQKTQTGFVSIGLEKNLSIETYTDKIYNSIKNNIEQIFSNHQNVLLCYSGGIDSLVVLSYIISLGYLKRTKLIVNNNKVSKSNGCLFYNSIQLDLTKDLIKKFSIDVDWIDIDHDYVYSLINYGHLNQLKTYSTNYVVEKYKNSAIVGGWHGNQVLLHKYVFWDEIIINRRCAKDEIINLLKEKNDFYTASLARYDVNKLMVPIEQVHMLQKPWAWHNGRNGNYVYSPLANDEIFQDLRRIDFKTVPVITIADAMVARAIIERNAGSEFNQYIQQESLDDGDSTTKFDDVPIKNINPSLFSIPSNLNHNPVGKQWLEYEIENSKSTGYIKFNCVMSLKTLEWLSKKL